MLYPYAEFPGELSVTYSQVIKDPSMKTGEKILVHFEKPTDFGFKEARYSLPDFKIGRASCRERVYVLV